MREEMAAVVFPVFNYGIALKERLANGENPDFAFEQSQIKQLLAAVYEASRNKDYGGESSASFRTQGATMGTISAIDAPSGKAGDSQFLGIHYALCCWLDEIFCIESPWSRQWNEKKMETANYKSNDRAYKFWDQAKRAENRRNSDILETFYLCVMLGFRGDFRDVPQDLEKWTAAVRGRLAKGVENDFKPPTSRGPAPQSALPMHGAEKFNRMLLSWGGVIILAAVLVLVAVLKGVFR